MEEIYRILKSPPRSGICVGSGWIALVIDCLQKFEALDFDIQVLQIKEKFGGLRIYVDNNTAQVGEIIKAAEEKVMKTCESCGEPGKLCSDCGWMMVRCDTCWESRL